jgi:hypothetical protein
MTSSNSNKACITTLSIDEAVPITGSIKSTMAERSRSPRKSSRTTTPTRSNMIFWAMVVGFSHGALTEIGSLALFMFLGRAIPHIWAWMLIWSFGQSLLCMLVVETMLILAGQSSEMDDGLSPMEVTFFGTHGIATASVYIVFSWCLVGSDIWMMSIGLVVTYLLLGVCCSMRSWVTFKDETEAAYLLMDEDEEHDGEYGA